MRISDYFENILKNINCERITKSYIIGIFEKYQNSELDLSKSNITLLYAQGVFKRDFYIFQNLGDWLFFTKSMYPEFLKNASEDYYNNIAQLSYYNCYKIVNTWKVYDQLSEEFPRLTR